MTLCPWTLLLRSIFKTSTIPCPLHLSGCPSLVLWVLASQTFILLVPAASAVRTGSPSWKFTRVTSMTLQRLPFLVPHCFSSEVEEHPREYFESICFSKTVLANFTNPAPATGLRTNELPMFVSSRSVVLDWGRCLKTSVVSVRKRLLAS